MQAVAGPHTTHRSHLLPSDTDGRCLPVCHHARARCMLFLPLQVESCSVKSSSPYSSQIISRFRFSCRKFNKIRAIFVSPNKFIKKLDSKIFPTIPIMYHKYMEALEMSKEALCKGMKIWIWKRKYI